MQDEKKSNLEFIPQFKRSFLLPQHWGEWLAIGLIASASFIPPSIRNPLLGFLGRVAGKLAKGARRRARINLLYCLPQLSEIERERIIDAMFATALQSIVFMAELVCRNPRHVLKRVRWHGEEILQQIRAEKKNVIFLVPHGWAVDIPAMLMAASGQPMAAMFHTQRSQLMDFVWNSVRRKFGGRMHARNDGIKPFINSVRQGYWGYYLPDQDHGAEHSVFVDFFATYKATLPAVGRLMKVCRAAVVPLFPVYDGKSGILDIYLRAPMDDLVQASDDYIARRMNEEVEKLVGPYPEQYTWILKLLKTRKEGEIEPYVRKDL